MTLIRFLLVIRFHFLLLVTNWVGLFNFNAVWANPESCQQILSYDSQQAELDDVKKEIRHFYQLGEAKDNGSGFLIPNETDLGQHRKQFQSLNKGFYLSVGTERGFMSAAMQGPNAEGLILVDRDPKVVAFNYYNRALLALAESRTDYLYLRQQATFEELQQRVHLKSKFILSDSNQWILTQFELWKWWTSLHQITKWKTFLQDPSLNPGQEFQGANYLFDDQLFQIISQLAKKNKIIIFNQRLENTLLLSQLDLVMNKYQSRISVIDTSNAWSSGYIGPSETINMLNRLKPLLHIQAHLVLTYLSQQRSYDGSSRFKFYFYQMYNRATDTELSLLMAQLQQMESNLQKSTSSRRPYLDDEM